MSKTVVSHEHINALVTFWAEHCTYGRTPSTQECQQVGEKLLMQNISSYSYRYPKEEVNAIETFFFYTYFRHAQHNGKKFTPVQMLKLIHCYRYQSDSNEGAEESEAWKLSDTMLTQATSMLPGYEQAEWGI